MFAQNIRDKKLECPKAGLFFDGTVKYLETLNGNNSLEHICERDLKQPAIKGQLGLFLALLVILLLIILGSRVEREIYQPRLALVRRQRILDR